MASGKFYHIYISPKVGVTHEDVEKKLDKALDWYRYTTGLYIVYSTSDTKMWMSRLKELVDPDGNLFVCELDTSNRTGWMPRDFWDWLKKSRT